MFLAYLDDSGTRQKDKKTFQVLTAVLINDPAFFPPQRNYWVDIPGTYHQGAGSFAFADGHVEAHRWRDAETVKAAREGGAGDGAHFTLVSPNNPDLIWLQEHATVRK